MKTKFNKYERIAGVFVCTAVFGSLAIFGFVAVKKGLFEEKLHLKTELKSADGVHAGTEVLMAGLRAGSVTNVKLVSNEHIMVEFEVGEAYRESVRESSVVRLVRPFIIGEKVLEVSVGDEKTKQVAQNALLQSEETIDLMDLASGRKLGAYLASMSAMTENAKYIIEQILDPKRSKNILKMFDELQPLVRNMVGVTGEVNTAMHTMNQKKQLSRMMDNMVSLTDEVNAMLPEFRKNSPQMASDLAKIMKASAILSVQLEKTLPLLAEATPELPKATRRAFEALDQTVITLKALQKSFLMRGNVREVHEEEFAAFQKEQAEKAAKALAEKEAREAAEAALRVPASSPAEVSGAASKASPTPTATPAARGKKK
jgi:phospholipid/cholesterol/gamma-HCH transport system substrate-binding protein